MPELPDVEGFRAYFNATALHQPIRRVEVNTRKVLKGVSPKRLEDRLKGATFDAASRHGKVLFAPLSKAGVVAFHFGMTGRLDYARQPREARDHDRVRFRFRNAATLAFVNQRLLGRIALAESPEAFVEQESLGPDALAIAQAAFRERLNGHRGALKSFLMDQEKLAGIGNICADEILFQARLHPKRKASALADKEARTLYMKMQAVLQRLVDNQTRSRPVPRTYLGPHRKGDGRCPRCGEDLTRITVGSRTGYACEACQG